jgi:hypothetical protein
LNERPLPIERLRKEGKILSDRQWLLRIIVLESVAGVPGMVGGTLRHLRSLRLLVSAYLRLMIGIRLIFSAEMEDGYIHYSKKQRTSECTFCESPSNPIGLIADEQDVPHCRSANMAHSIPGPRCPGGHVQPLLPHVHHLFQDGS